MDCCMISLLLLLACICCSLLACAHVLSNTSLAQSQPKSSSCGVTIKKEQFHSQQIFQIDRL